MGVAKTEDIMGLNCLYPGCGKIGLNTKKCTGCGQNKGHYMGLGYLAEQDAWVWPE